MNRKSSRFRVSKLLLNILFSVLIFTLTLPCFVKGASNIPEPTNLKYINDYVGIIDDDTKSYIVSLGSELENKTSSQMTVVIINSLEGKDVESYANELFRTWGIGQKGKDNGLLILLSINDRKWRVEVGRELEGVITDIYSSRVMDNSATPLFKEGRYSEGLKSAYSIFAKDIAKEYNVNLQGNNGANDITQQRKGIVIKPAVIYGILGAFVLDIIFNRARITRFLLYAMFWNSFWGRGPRGGGGFGGGGHGGFGGGNSGGGGSSGNW